MPPDNQSQRRRILASGILVIAATATAGCDPVVNFYGSFFPAWVLALAAGLVLTGIARWILAAARLEPHLGPLILMYPALAFILSCVTWLLLFGP